MGWTVLQIDIIPDIWTNIRLDIDSLDLTIKANNEFDIRLKKWPDTYFKFGK